MEILQHSQNLETAHSPESAAYSFSMNSVTHPVLSSTLAPILI